MTVYVADVHVNLQKLVLVVKMMTMLEECPNEQQHSIVLFFFFSVSKWTQCKGKKYFLFMGVKCFSSETVHTWVANVSLLTKKLKGGAQVAETTVKRLIFCGFLHTGKVMGQVHECRWRIYREINVFLQVRISRVAIYIRL
jgi:hypothetical protein